MRRVVLRAAVLFAAAALALTGCRTAPPGPAGPASAAAAEDDGATLLIHALHRNARLRSGALDADAVAALADAAAIALSGDELPLDAWQAIAGEGARAVVVAVPDAGPLAQAVAARLRLLAAHSGDVVLHEGGLPASIDRRAEIVVVARFTLDAGSSLQPSLAPALSGLRAAGREPIVVFGDLLDPAVGGTHWPADVVVASQDPAAVVFDAEFTLRARAAGAVPDAQALAAARGVNLATLDWKRIALAR